MSNAFFIRPSRDLRNHYSQISQLCHQNPVAITVNGREDTVVMSHEDYLSQQNRIAVLEEKLRIYEHLAQAADDIKLGRVQDTDAAFAELLDEL